MNRETKIGLLVGLAFVIAVGILLSDKLSSTTETPGAPLRLAGNNLRNGVGDPAAPVTNFSPNQQLPTREDLHARSNRPPITLVGSVPTNPVNPNTHDLSPRTGNGNPGGIRIPGRNGLDDLRDIARRNGEEIVNPNNDPMNNVTPPGGDVAENGQPFSQQQRGAGTRPGTNPGGNLNNGGAIKLATNTYKAQAGDSLSRITAKAYGVDSIANRNAIINANPSLKENPDRVVLGKSYIIPPPPGQTRSQQQPITDDRAIAPQPNAPATPTEPAASVATVQYTVQENDTLWSIARDELGDPHAVATLKELNKDKLKGSDTLRVNMKLRLPAKKPVERVATDN